MLIGPQTVALMLHRRLPLLLAIVVMAVMPLLALAEPSPAESTNQPAAEETAGGAEYDPDVGLSEIGENSTIRETGVARISSLGTLTGSLIGQVIALIGVIFFVLMIYAGIIWMTAGGSEERVTKAKGIMTGAVVGMIIVFASYHILEFILNAIYQGLGAETAAPVEAPAE